MRKARYDLKQVVCKNSSTIGYSSNVAKPGHWITWRTDVADRTGRVLGRISESDRASGVDCAGYLAVIWLHGGMQSAGVAWVNPSDVTACYSSPPAALMAWLTGDDWVGNKGDIARIVAMQEHGSCSEQFIANRNDPEHAYNARPEYVKQFILD